jgi:outer membrane protein assembly factor BamB
MRQLILWTFTLPAAAAIAQDDVRYGDNGADALLRTLTEAAPLLDMERVELELTPALDIDQVSGLTADEAGNLYIIQRGKAADPIIVTDSTGRVLRSFGRGLFNRPHSIRIDPAGNVWTVDSNTSMVYKFSPGGEKLLEISVGDVPDPDNESCAASDIAFGANGQVYVADGYCNARVVVYDAAGRKIREWGRAGTGPGELNLPHSIATSPEGEVYVADRENGRVQWFTPDGGYLGEWRYGGRVLSVAFSAEGDLYISAEPKDAVPQQEATLLHVDRHDGSVLGKLDDFGHEISVGADGTLLPASLTERITIYR